MQNEKKRKVLFKLSLLQMLNCCHQLVYLFSFTYVKQEKFLFNCPLLFCFDLYHVYNPDEDYVEVKAKLQGHLESFLEIVRSFNMIYTKEICPWTHMMVGSQLHGFGPAANRLLEAYKMLLKTRNATGLGAPIIATGLGA
ncbi:unnamed protein product [Camellia sinensis]